MNKNKERLSSIKGLCKALGVTFRRAYTEKRTEGAITIKLWYMRSPTAAQCEAMVRKAEQLGASKYGFKRASFLSTFADPIDGWSFIMHFEPETAPKQQSLFTTPRWPGNLQPSPADELH